MPISQTLAAPFLSWSRRLDVHARLAYAWRVLSTRETLRELEPRMLRDVGITRHDAVQEINRPVWDLMR
ncbi:MAG: DUF1127 domain-containing protein [Acetobacteraceae bacterium]|nr:DUF1127 domain-containing protein [Acetobacteraceae bacterium]